MAENCKLRKGRKMFEHQSPVIKDILEWNGFEIDEFSIGIPKKKQPILSKKVHQRLYGIPGQNIFTYDIDKPRPRISFKEQIDVGMVPKEDAITVTRGIMRLNKEFKDSLDKSLLPNESSETKIISKTILNRDHISKLKNGQLISKEDSGDLFIPKIGTSLIPVSRKISRRRQIKMEHVNEENKNDKSLDSEDAIDKHESINQLNTWPTK